MFNYGGGLRQVTAKQLACDTGGIYEHVEDGGDLSQAMAFFYRYDSRASKKFFHLKQ